MSRSLFSPALAVLLLLAGCDRNIEPFDPDEKTAPPDLSRIFPEGAFRSPDPAQAAAPEPPPAALTGTITISPEMEAQMPRNAILFVIARTVEGMPPTAVKRIEAPSFPFEFSLGPGDRMIDAFPFEGPFRLVARLDADGNASSRNPGDMKGESGGHMPGEENIQLVIDEVL